MSIDTPQGGGALQGIGETFQPDLHMGTGNFTIAVPVPPGRAGLTPTLSLAYSSGNGNGPFGLGWALSVPRIARRTDRGIPSFDDDEDVFVLSGAEELVPVPLGAAAPGDVAQGASIVRYRPRTESTWARIVHVSGMGDDYWDVTSQEGLHSRYGTQRPDDANPDWSDPAVVVRPDGRTFAWLLSATRDSFDNHILYGYAGDEGAQRYLSSIRYGDYGDPSNPDYAITIAVGYETRADDFSDRKAGFDIHTSLRGANILVTTVGSSGEPVTAVDVTYSDSAAAISLLSTVTVTGVAVDPAESVAYPPVTFEYRDWQPQTRSYRRLDAKLPPRALGAGLELVDLFADGLPSVVELDGVARYWRNRGDGTFDAARSLTDAPAAATFGAANTALVDVDGDGRPDLLVSTGAGTTRWTISPDPGGRAGFIPGPPASGGAPSVGYTDPNVRVMDLDADHLADILIGGESPGVALGNGTGGFDNLRPLLEPPPPLGDLTSPNVFFADFTGDGLTDIAIVNNGNVQYWPSLGGGNYDSPVRMSGAPQFDDTWLSGAIGFDPRRLLLGSVTGLGPADIVYVGDGHVTVWLNQSGTGFSAPTVIRGTPRVSNQSGVRLSDLFGIGVSGILWTGLGLDAHWAFLDLTGGAKPYLMTDVDNNSGNHTALTWSTSTVFALADRAAGIPWRTTLPFPVHVLQSSRSEDEFSHTVLLSTYAYHEGYWDPGDWEFRGFARVEQSDALTSPNPILFDPQRIESLDPLTPRSEVPTDFDASSHGNLVANWTFDEAGGPSTTFTTSVDDPFGGSQSAAPGWGIWHNAATMTTTELLASDLPHGQGGQMLHVSTGAGGCGLVQTMTAPGTGPERIVASIWLRIVRGTVGLGVGDGGDTSIDIETSEGGWVLVSASNAQSPANELIVYATSDGGAEFYVDHAWVRVEDSALDVASYPPIRTESWFHLGPVGPADGDWMELDYARDYWAGDPAPRTYLDDSQLPADIPRPLLREVLRGLRGRVLRTELYSDDGDPIYSALPYEVHDSAIQVVPVLDGRAIDDPGWLAAPVVSPREDLSRAAFWDRGSDPMFHFSATQFDEYGRPVAVVQAGVARGRTTIDEPGEPCLATVSYSDYATRDDSSYYLDRIARARTFEAVDDGSGSVIDFLNDALAGSRDGSLRSLSLSYYDGEALVGLPTGSLDEHAALSRVEHLVVTPTQLTDFSAAVNNGGTATALPPYLAIDGAAATPSDWIGYPSEFEAWIDGAPGGPSVGYLWSADDQAHVAGYYAQASRSGHDFQLDPAGQSRGLVLESRDVFGGTTSTTWDEYALLPVQTVDPLGLTTTASYDYRHFKPSLITDANLNQTKFGYSPLGLPAWIAKTGKVGESEGDTVDQPGQIFVYDFDAPISVRTTRRVDHRWTLIDRENTSREAAGLPALTLAEVVAMFPVTEQADSPERFIVTTEYSDGSGRLLQKRVQADENLVGDVGLPLDATVASATVSLDASAADARVVVSSWRLYDNKGRPVVDYEPFESEGFDYLEPDVATLGGLASEIHRYDARGRNVVTRAPDGSEHRTVFGIPSLLADPSGIIPTPWETFTYGPLDNGGRTHPTTSLDSVGSWDTPSSALVDALGRAVRVTQRGLDVEVVTLNTYDIEGRLTSITDPLDRVCALTRYDCVGGVWLSWILDGGTVREFRDAAGGVVERRDDKSAMSLTGFDVAHRPVRVWASDSAGQAATLRSATLFGDDPTSGLTRDAAVALNSLGKAVTSYDDAGSVKTSGYDLDGNPVDATRTPLRPDVVLSLIPTDGVADWTDTAFVIDWTPGAGGTFAERATGLVASAGFETTTTFDALGRRVTQICPTDATGARATIDYEYGRGGGITGVAVDGSAIVTLITYDAHGRRVLASLANGVVLRYAYDPLSLRLRRSYAQRSSQAGTTWSAAGPVLQDLTLRCDIEGNIVTIRDQAPGSGMPAGADPIHSPSPDLLDRQLVYDALNRLLSATGRETDVLPAQPWLAGPRSIDLTKARRYSESYTYDLVGNLLGLNHQTDAASAGSYVRSFTLEQGSNRLAALGSGQSTVSYASDAVGNQLSEFGNRLFEWNHAGRLVTFRDQAGASIPSVYAQYRYDVSGERVMKVVRKVGSLEVTVLSGAMRRLSRQQADGSWLNYDTLEIIDGASHVASLTRGDPIPDDPLNDQPTRYQLADHLASVSATLGTDGTILNREEYLPYGETSFGSVAYKRYRFTGKERDEESGLNYHSARYYSPWKARFLSADPLPRPPEGAFTYAGCSPLVRADPTGRTPQPRVTGTHYEYLKDGKVDMTSAPDSSPRSGKSRPFNLQQKRNPKYFWTTLEKAHPEWFSAENVARMHGKRFRSPRVDAKWLEYFPDPSWEGQTLHHHHLDLGPIAVPIPKQAHELFHGPLHYLEPHSIFSVRGAILSAGKTLSIAGTVAAVGDVAARASEGDYKGAAENAGIGLASDLLLKRVPVLVPVAIATSALLAYQADSSIDQKAFAVADKLVGENHPYIGGAVSATAAIGISLFQGTFGAMGKSIGEGASAVWSAVHRE